MYAWLFAATLLALGAPPSPGGISLTPAVVTLTGMAGQSTTQRLTLRNDASVPLSFVMEAKDVVVREGRRELVVAGEVRSSIAATAVFSSRTVTVPPGQARSVDVTLTIPPGVEHRAVVALFRGTTLLGDPRAPSTASLGTLLAFELSDRRSLAAEDLRVTPQSPTANTTFEELVANDGAEPVVAKGAAVLLDGAGAIVARVAFEPRRVLPGERSVLRAEYGGELPPGRYRALSTVDWGGSPTTRGADLVIP
jgi:hypothetical protein